MSASLEALGVMALASSGGGVRIGRPSGVVAGVDQFRPWAGVGVRVEGNLGTGVRGRVGGRTSSGQERVRQRCVGVHFSSTGDLGVVFS